MHAHRNTCTDTDTQKEREPVVAPLSLPIETSWALMRKVGRELVVRAGLQPH